MACQIWNAAAEDGISLHDAVARAKGLKFHGTAGNDSFTGAGGRDHFYMQGGGDDVVRGHDGHDSFFFGSSFNSADLVDGGRGSDRVILEGNYSSVVYISGDHFSGIEQVQIKAALSYDLAFGDGFKDFKVFSDFSALLIMDASKLTTGSVTVHAGGRADMITGGSGDDVLLGGTGGDTLAGGPGGDRFVYTFDGDSRDYAGGTPDTIVDFAKGDQILLPSQQIPVAHIGPTAGRIGDVVAQFDSISDVTRIDVFFDADSRPDMTFLLLGEHDDLRILHDNHIGTL